MGARVLVIGGGPAGAAAALHLAARGIEPLVVERESYPRFHIGESLTGEAGRLLKELGFGERLDGDDHPHKFGVNVFGPKGHDCWHVPVMARNAAGELTPDRTWQVRRSRFDGTLLDAALERGADLLPGDALEPLRDDRGAIRGARVRTAGGRELEVEADVTLDCSGSATFLAHHGVTGPKYVGNYDRQVAIFTHVRGARLEADERQSIQPGNTLIFYRSKYHWAWVIPIDSEVTSVGVVVPSDTFRERGETKADFLMRQFRELNPGLAERLQDIEVVEPARAIVNYSYQVQDFTGPGFMCLGDAHRFIDPIFSFGVNVALREAEMGAEAVERYLAGEGRDRPNPFRDHLLRAEHAIDVLEDMVDFFWEQPLAFAYYVHARYREGMIDTFAGRIYHGQTFDWLENVRGSLGRERRYDDEDLVSMPIGSRYHPERAPIWQQRIPTGLELE